MNRRDFLALSAVLAIVGPSGRASAGQESARPDRIERPDQEWRRILPESRYRILRREDTEPPFSSALNEEKRKGTFLCAGCALPLFTTEMKYDSGTGWPSFFQVLPDAIGTRTDFRMILPRTEYHCARCGGHQGHVFKDGPKPTGLRYCNNGLALRFEPAPAMG